MKILMLVYGRLGEHVSGPQIRGMALARELASNHEVTVAIGDGSGVGPAGIRVVDSRRQTVAREAWRHDAFYAPDIPPYVLALRSLRSLLTVSDQYDPVELEMALHEGRRRKQGMRAARAARKLQLSYADAVVCANDAQREMLLAELEGVRRRIGEPAVGVVPFGLPAAPERSRRRPLRERFPQITDSDRVVLWWGSVWRWLDAETAMRAVADLESTRLVITAGPPPSANADLLSAADEAREAARALGLLGDKVLFLDEWIPYEDRHHYLMDADVGITLHRGTAEAAVAARSRYLDYLWAGLPCVLAGGDEMAESFRRIGFAELVPPQDTRAVVAALERVLGDERTVERRRAAGARLAATLGWDTAAAALASLLDAAPPPRRLSPAASLSLLTAVSREYAHLARDAISGWAQSAAPKRSIRGEISCISSSQRML